MIETASNAGPRLAFEVCFIVPQFVPGVPAPRRAALWVGEGEEEVVGSEEAVTVTMASVGLSEEVEGGVADAAAAEERTLGQKLAAHCCISVERLSMRSL